MALADAKGSEDKTGLMDQGGAERIEGFPKDAQFIFLSGRRRRQSR
jgi:hypothetical protein